MEKMTHDYIRQIIPEEISEKGGAHLRLVGGKTVPLETSIKEAKAAGYVLGDEELVKRQFDGLIQSMKDGVEADGMARQIGGWVTVYPVFVGPIDLAKGYDPEKNGIRIRMRLLNEIDVDITDWEFRDVTPGRTPFTIDSASTGELVNTVKVGDPIHVNGRPFPPNAALRVDWAVEGTDKSGTIPAAKFTSDATLITIAADALAELASEEYDGKTVVFTVRGNFASAKIAATLKYVAPTPTRRISVESFEMTGSEEGAQGPLYIDGIDGVKGYRSEGNIQVEGDLYLNGELVEEGATLGGPPGMNVVYPSIPSAHVGDTVKVVLHPDPAKTDFVQEDAVAEAVVKEAS